MLRDLVLQVSVLQLAPAVPANTCPLLSRLLKKCLQTDPAEKPCAADVYIALQSQLQQGPANRSMLERGDQCQAAENPVSPAPLVATPAAELAVPDSIWQLVGLLHPDKPMATRAQTTTALASLAQGNSANQAAIAAVPGALGRLVALL